MYLHLEKKQRRANGGINASTRPKLITTPRFSVQYRIATSAAAFETTEAHALAKRHPGRQQVRLCACPYHLNGANFPSPDRRSSISSNSPGETFGAKLRALPLPAKHSREHEESPSTATSSTAPGAPNPKPTTNRPRIGPIPHPHRHRHPAT